MLSRAEAIKDIFSSLSSSFDFSRPADTCWDKQDGNEWVSELDIQVNDFLTKELSRFFPGENVASEEAEKADLSKPFWIIDPIDGTHNFLSGTDLFGTLIAFCNQGKVLASGVFLPFQKESWVAELGKGVWLNGKEFQSFPVRGKPFAFANSALRYIDDNYLYLLRDLSKNGFSVRLTGSGAHNYATLAKSGGVYVDQTPHLWDAAPAIGLFSALGAKVVNFDQQPWKVGDKSFVIIYNLEREKEKKFWELLIKEK